MKSCWLLAACVLTAGVAPGQVFERFETSPFSPPPAGPVIAVLDADLDGAIDMLVLNAAAQTIDFYRNEGPHNFVVRHASPFTDAPPSETYEEPVLGDIDGDGDLDVLRGTKFIENLGGGAFQVRLANFGPTIGGQQPSLLDMDGDGDLDVLQVDRLLRNDGNWLFTTVTVSNVPEMPLLVYTATVIDVERDGDMDFVIGVALPPGEVFLFRNDGFGFFAREPVASSGLADFRLHTVDLNLDGHDDVAVMGGSQTFALTNDGTGAFTLDVAHLGADLDGSFVDWNGTGHPFFVGTSGVWQPRSPFAWLNAYPPEIATPAQAWVADMDGDLDLDLVIGSQASLVTNPGSWYLESASRARLAQPFTMLENHTASVVYGQLHEAMFATWNATELTVYSDTYSNHRAYPVPFQGPEPVGITDLAIVGNVDPFGYPDFGQILVTCTGTGPTYHEQEFWGLEPASPSPLPALGTPTHVAAGDLDGIMGDDLVFGDPAIDGPRIVMRTATGFVEQLVTLPPATPSLTPAFEAVLLADMDGDGDQDIFHELRILRNDGGGQWSVGASIPSTIPLSARKFDAIDFDHDGDQDLLASNFGLRHLLENDGGTFHEVTIGMIPLAALGKDVAGIADVDRDGDDDIILAGIVLLRNDNGVFTSTPNSVVGSYPGSIAIDLNYDGSPDVVTGNGVYENTHTFLRPVRRAALGGDWELQVRTWREGVLPQVAFVAVAIGNVYPIHVPLGDMGTLMIDLTQATVTAIPLAGGIGNHVLAIPASPLVWGAQLNAQALVVDDRLLLTGAVQDQVR